MEIQIPISKVEPKKRMAFGFANVFRLTTGDAVVDAHDETIDSIEAIAAIEDAVYRYVLESRSGDEMHETYGVARLVETIVLTEEKREAFARHAAYHEAGGNDEIAKALLPFKLAAANAVLPDAWWVGFKIDDDDVWAKVDDGVYPMFSIVGRGRSEDL